MIWRVKSREWNVRPFAKCPNCGRLLRIRAEECPECGRKIDEQYAFYSALVVTVITQACSFANTIKHLDLGALIIIVVSLYVYLVGEPMLFAFVPMMSVMPLLAVVWWLCKFGRYKFDDEDFVKAKRDMRASLKLWLTLFVVQLISVAATWR